MPVDSRILPGDGGICPWEIGDTDRSEIQLKVFKTVCGVWPLIQNIGGDILAYVVVRPAKPKARGLVRKVFEGQTAIATIRGRRGAPRHEVPLQDVVTLGAVFKHYPCS